MENILKTKRTRTLLQTMSNELSDDNRDSPNANDIYQKAKKKRKISHSSSGDSIETLSSSSPAVVHDIGGLTSNEQRMLLKIFGSINSKRLQNFLFVASRCCTFNETDHSDFCNSFINVWTTRNFPNEVKGRGAVRWRSTLTDWEKRKANANTLAFLFKIGADGSVIGFISTLAQYTSIMYHIVVLDSWRNKIKDLAEIPPSILQGLRACEVRPESIFKHITRIDNSIPALIGRCVCIERIKYFDRVDLKVHSPTWEKAMSSIEIESSLTDSDYSSSSECEQSDMNETFGATARKNSSLNGPTLLISNTRVVLLTGNALKGVKIGDHDPYTISAITFCLASQLENSIRKENERMKITPELEWTPRRIYFFIKDWLADQIRISSENIPAVLHETCRLFLHWIIGGKRKKDMDVVLWNELSKASDIFANCRGMIMAHTTQKINKRGSLIPCKQMSTDEYAKFMRDGFYEVHRPSPHRSASSSLHLSHDIDTFQKMKANGKTASKQEILSFEREKVSPIRLYSTICYLNWKFGQSMRSGWKVLFSDNLTVLLINDRHLRDIVQTYVPYIASIRGCFRRNVCFPLYPFHLHNYFYGDKLALSLSMRFLLRCFCSSKDIKKITEEDLSNSNVDDDDDDNNSSKDNRIGTSLTPIDPEDHIVNTYSLLHEIMDRFGSTNAIWDALITPLRDPSILWSSRVGTVPEGFREDTPTIYSALRAFIQIYAPHFISVETLGMLQNLFLYDSQELQALYPLAWKLVRKLLDNCTGDMYFYMDPGMLISNGFCYPAHIALYFLCCAPEISDEIAIIIFMSISIGKSRQYRYGTTGAPISALRFPQQSSRKISQSQVVMNHSRALKKASDKWRALCKMLHSSSANNLRGPIKRSGALDFLFQSVEEIFLRRFESMWYPVSVERNKRGKTSSTSSSKAPVDTKDRTSVSQNARESMKCPDYHIGLRADEILIDPKNPPDLPLDMRKKEVIMPRASFPIFESLIREAKFVKLEESREACPFSGCKEDFMECIILNPITTVQCPEDHFNKSKFAKAWEIPDERESYNALMALTMDEIEDTTPYDLRKMRSPKISDFGDSFEDRPLNHNMLEIADNRTLWDYHGKMPSFLDLNARSKSNMRNAIL